MKYKIKERYSIILMRNVYEVYRKAFIGWTYMYQTPIFYSLAEATSWLDTYKPIEPKKNKVCYYYEV